MLCFLGKVAFPRQLALWPRESVPWAAEWVSFNILGGTPAPYPGLAPGHPLPSGSPKQSPSFQVGAPRSQGVLQGVRAEHKRGGATWPPWRSRRTCVCPAPSGCARAHSPHGHPQASSARGKGRQVPLGALTAGSALLLDILPAGVAVGSWPAASTRHAPQQGRGDVASVLPGGHRGPCFAGSERAVSFRQVVASPHPALQVIH